MTDPRHCLASLSDMLGQARPSNLRLGQQIAAEGHVAITAVVTGPPGTSRRTVRFTPDGGDTAWSWSCTCMSAESPWCKHLVAAVIAARDAEAAHQQAQHPQGR